MNLEHITDERTAGAPVKARVIHDAPGTRLIAGVGLADNPLITAAIEYAQRLSQPYLFNDAMRSLLLAETIGRIKESTTTAKSWRLARYSTTLVSPPVCQGPIASR